MDAATRAWLISQLGTATNLADLDQRYTRLASARAVALEVLRERLADLMAEPSVIGVSSVVNLNTTANIAALERQIARLESGEPPAPGDPTDDDADSGGFDVVQLIERPRR